MLNLDLWSALEEVIVQRVIYLRHSRCGRIDSHLQQLARDLKPFTPAQVRRAVEELTRDGRVKLVPAGGFVYVLMPDDELPETIGRLGTVPERGTEL